MSSRPRRKEPASLGEAKPLTQATSGTGPEVSRGSSPSEQHQKADTPLQTPPSILARLPLECWLQILEYLPQNDLANISLVCRGLNTSATALLYKTIDWGWQQGPDEEPPFLRLIKLIQTISDRPELGALVQHLSSLRTLKLDSSFIYYDGYTGLMMTHALFGAPPGVMSDSFWLQAVDYGSNAARLRVQHVSVPIFRVQEQFDRSQFVGWFFLPRLMGLKIWIQSPCLASDIGNGTKIQPSNLAQLRHLGILQAMPNTGDINKFISQMKSIKYLMLGLQYGTCLEELQSIAGTAPGLSSLSNSIETLSLSPAYSVVRPETEVVCAGDQAGLKLPHDIFNSFERLAALSIPLPLLLSWGAHQNQLTEALSTSLRDLILRECFLETQILYRRPKEAIQLLNKFLLDDVHRFPLLRSITLVVDNGSAHQNSASMSDQIHLRELAQQYQVAVRVTQLDGTELV
ncbi:uncharacterized protein N7496_006276 [Penicillium cataractarum]|uniref:F-box domain-containing protein n=1 Tax=Penicillium cataractarum TaxID=2100454 RepID=A0A9W9S360_9EURO|nr:uncharacterized protein N7496_006276 [Penicillium cataractarum]KAJ5370184.1 hypothetical protein N7496_006276 [Penicillium cataractarum]